MGAIRSAYSERAAVVQFATLIRRQLAEGNGSRLNGPVRLGLVALPFGARVPK